MGYFSRKAVEIQERRRFEPDGNYLPEADTLKFRLAELQDRLDELNELRSLDVMSPRYDRYFYEDYITHYGEEPNTVQGILRAMAEIRELIAEQEQKRQEWQRLVSSVRKTGADPYGQFAFVNVFLSA